VDDALYWVLNGLLKEFNAERERRIDSERRAADWERSAMTLAEEHKAEQRCRAEAERELERIRTELSSRNDTALREPPILQASLWLNEMNDLVEWSIDAHNEIVRLRNELGRKTPSG